MAQAKEDDMKERSSFGVYPRRLKSGKIIYYYWAYESTGADTHEKAIRYCRNLLKQGKLINDKTHVFSRYTENFFVFEKCPYIRSRILRGKSYTKSWAHAQRNLLIARIIPEFGDKDIREIYESHIESWLLRLRQEGVGTKTLNHLITIMRLIFGYALKCHDIEDNPMEYIELFALMSAEKGILSNEELKSLFCGDVLALWGSMPHFVLNLTAVLTGMRLGELLALRFLDVQPSFITVSHSWNAMDQLKTTKNGKTRRIPIPEELYPLLHSLDKKGDKTGFIFAYSDKPMDHKTVYRYFYNALEKIGIDRQSRHMKRISFHSYRHCFNTKLLERGIPPETVRLLTGHSAGMTARYSHVQLQNVNYQFPIEINTLIDLNRLLPAAISTDGQS